jgi:organic radical activating enzyme
LLLILFLSGNIFFISSNVISFTLNFPRFCVLAQPGQAALQPLDISNSIFLIVSISIFNYKPCHKYTYERCISRQKNEYILNKYGSNFCAAPFTSFHEGENGLISTCCKTRNPLGFTSEKSIEEILNSDEAKKIRKQFLNNEKPEQCISCWKAEESGKISSNRFHSNYTGFDNIDNAVKNTQSNGTLLPQVPVWLDLLWTNKCNFSCLGCKPTLSSTIANKYMTEFSILHDVDYAKSTQSWKNSNQNKIDYILKHKDTIKIIHLNGGEPLMAEDLYEFLEILIDNGLHKKITIWSHTNGSIGQYKGKDLILDYLSQWGDKCKITLSNDGHGKYGEYIRYGYTDHKWIETYKKIKEAKISFNIQSCLNVFNVFYLDEFSDWIYKNLDGTDQKIVHGSLTLWLNETLSIRMLNHVPALKEEAIKNLENVLNKKNIPSGWKTIESHINWLKLDNTIKENHLISFYNGISAIDKKRKTNLLEVFPKIEPLYHLAKSKV